VVAQKYRRAVKSIALPSVCDAGADGVAIRQRDHAVLDMASANPAGQSRARYRQSPA
jgi:hypothetical protein